MRMSTVQTMEFFSKACTRRFSLPSLLLCGLPLESAPKKGKFWNLDLHDTLGLAHFPRVNHALPSGVAGCVCYMQSLQ